MDPGGAGGVDEVERRVSHFEHLRDRDTLSGSACPDTSSVTVSPISLNARGVVGFWVGVDAKSALASGIMACQRRFATPAEGHFSYAESIAGFVAFTCRVR